MSFILQKNVFILNWSRVAFTHWLWRQTRTKNGGFLFSGNGPEAAHLLPYTQQNRKQQYQNITRLHAQGLSLRQIADRLGIANSTVHRVLQKLEIKAETEK